MDKAGFARVLVVAMSSGSLMIPGSVAMADVQNSVLDAVVGTLVGPAASTRPSAPGGADPERLIRCLTIDGERFCTELGFVDFDKGSEEWSSYLAKTLAAKPTAGSGDMPLGVAMDQVASLSAQELDARQQEQIADARSAVGRLILSNSLFDETPLPDGFFSQYPDLNIAEGSPRARALQAEAAGTPLAAGNESALVSAAATPPNSKSIMSAFSKQTRDYWCGPATMKTIADFAGVSASQAKWASRMGTTTSGSSTQSIVSAINSYTTLDTNGGGAYVVLSTPSSNTSTWFMSLHRSNIGLFNQPIVEHVQLLKAYFPYLERNHNGHFQAGRGYDTSAGQIRIAEVYNEADWGSGGAQSAGFRTVPLSNMWSATLANVHRNIGW